MSVKKSVGLHFYKQGLASGCQVGWFEAGLLVVYDNLYDMPNTARFISMKTNRFPSSRANRGGVLVEGVVAFGLVIFGAVIGALFLANVGVSTYHKEKLAFISNQAAEFAYAQMSKGLEFQDTTKSFVQTYLPLFGIPGSNLVVNVSRQDLTIGSSVVPTAVVEITNTFNLIGNGSVLPTTIRLTEKAAASNAVTVLAAAGPPGPKGDKGDKGDPGSGNSLTSAPAFLRMPTTGNSNIWIPIARVAVGPSSQTAGGIGSAPTGAGTDPGHAPVFQPTNPWGGLVGPQTQSSANIISVGSTTGGDLTGFTGGGF